MQRPPASPYAARDALLDEAVQQVIARVGPRIRLATPLGIGKPNPLVDAFYRRACGDPGLDLRIFTALSLSRPRPQGELERRFLEPLLDRVFGSYPDPAFAKDLMAERLPANVRVTSFYYQPGSALASGAAQRSHVNTNYTHVVRDLIGAGVNVLAQLVAAPPPGEEDAVGLSLASNPDLTLDLLPWLLARRAAGDAVALVAQVNRQLPFMYGDAVVGRDVFDRVLDAPELEFDLFAPPNAPVADVDYAIGLHVSALVRDGGTLQLGIGALGDAVSHLLLTRHRRNATYQRLLEAAGLLVRQPEAFRLGGTEPFREGLYGSSEMLMQGLLELFRGGVLRRRSESGHALHACFFLGPRAFYRALREMPADERRAICMTRISYVNELYGDEARKRADRRHARFVNTGMVATLLGAVASDGLEDGRVVSGVGGQYNFVAMGHELEDGRSILLVRSVREEAGDVTSNVRFAYGHVTIPRHLRDVIVTEYGVADLRGKPDEEVVHAMLEVADSRFQDALLTEAKEAGKVRPDHEIDERFRSNTPERIRTALAPFRADGTLPDYPFGTDLTDVEVGLLRALRYLKRTMSGELRLPHAADVRKALDVPPEAEPYLARMGLADTDGAKEELMRRALVYGLAAEDVV